ncbi:MAG: glycoside hydrolase family 3 N-terminal domain-containing protein [Pseudobdellovibrionaceae bacterium]
MGNKKLLAKYSKLFLTFLAGGFVICFSHEKVEGAERKQLQDSNIIVVKDLNTNPKRLTAEQQKKENDLEADITVNVNALLKQMSIEEKVGQMTQITLDVVIDKASLKSENPTLDPLKLKEAILKYHVGSILNVAGDKAHTLENWHKLLSGIQDAALKDRLKIPILYGVDSIHGAHYTRGATVFPQSISLAATWNPSLSAKVGEITALETRISGIPWNFFPVLDIGRQELWPRFYETYGEDVVLAQHMAWANILGQQGLTKNNLAGPRNVASCMKHYVGYSFPWSGKDRTPAIITEKMMREYFLPTFETAVKAGSETVMINSGEVDGIPGHANYHLITEVLKGEMKFKGFAVSDWEDIKRLYTRDHYASSPEEAVRIAIMAGVDMSMVPYDYSFAEILVKLVKQNKVPMSRIDDAVKRILRVKYLLGIFEKPYPNSDSRYKSLFGSKDSEEANLNIAAEAITLLKNDNTFLPLPNNSKVLVTGPTANSLAALNGGWTLTWQGDKEELYPRDKKTVYRALQDQLGTSNVSFAKGIEFNKKADDYELALQMARDSDVVVLCLGEKPYTETPGNIDDLNLDSAQIEFAQALHRQGKPVVLILIQGRPRVIREIEPLASAVVLAYLPGMEGGRAISEVLTGKVNPSGKLPFSYPRYVNSLVPYDHKYQEVADGNVYNPQWPFGFGLSYSKFSYSNLEIESKTFGLRKSLKAKVTVTNDSDIEGKEVVQLYLSDLYRTYSSPPVKKLIDFKKVNLPPHTSQEIVFEIKLEQLSFIAPDNRRIVEKGTFKIQIQNLVNFFVL